MEALIRPAALAGRAAAIGSKSDIHRALICAALADAPTRISGMLHSEDIDATAGCLGALGAEVAFEGDVCTVTPNAVSGAGVPLLNCRESGSTLRFLLPVAAAVRGEASFTGAGRLPGRPIGELVSAMRSGGVSFSAERLPLSISGRLAAGEYRIAGSVSSQYISGLLMALSAVEGESRIVITDKLESASYVSMTLHTLRVFGADVEETGNGYIVRGRGRLASPVTMRADGDWSNAAFFLAAGAIGGPVTLAGLDVNSIQGDRRVLDILERFGASVERGQDGVTVSQGSLRGCTVELSDIPDLLPALAVVAANAEGETRFTGGARLRLKESDRLATTAALINRLGGHAEELADGLVVSGGGLRGGSADGSGDHRIVMAAAIAGTRCADGVRISGAQAVNKSYPDFFAHFARLGGAADVV